MALLTTSHYPNMHGCVKMSYQDVSQQTDQHSWKGALSYAIPALIV